jgi:hypothetical protein
LIPPARHTAWMWLPQLAQGTTSHDPTSKARAPDRAPRNPIEWPLRHILVEANLMLEPGQVARWKSVAQSSEGSEGNRRTQLRSRLPLL